MSAAAAESDEQQDELREEEEGTVREGRVAPKCGEKQRDGENIMAPAPISTAYLIHLSYQPVFLHVYSPIIARKRLGKNVTVATKDCWHRFLLGPCRIRGK
jgi:hypothetical protein